MSLKQIALRYFDAGVTVFPTTSHRKNPSLKEWRQYQDKKPSKSQIKKWFSRNNVTGILALCGEQSNLTVVDDDSYKTGSPLELESLIESKTASGGRHIYFRYSPDVDSHNIRTDDHEFEIQNDGKLVMMPPSRAKNKQGEIGEYKWIKKHSNIKTLPILTSDFTTRFETTIRESKEMVNLLDVDLGQQHNSLRTMINKLLFQTPKADWDSKVYPVIKAAANNYNPPHPPRRVEKLWCDCRAFVESKKTERLMPKSLQQVSRERKIERKLEEKAPSTGYWSLDRYIKGFIPGHLYLVSGDTNVGKTSASANFAVNVAEAGGKVLYIALEPDNTVIDYLNCCAFDLSYSEAAEHDDYTSENIDVYTKDQIESLDQMIRLVGKLSRYDLIIIDHIGYFTTSNRGDTLKNQSNAVKKLVQFAKRKKMAVMIIAHLRKNTNEIPTINDISGSGALKQDSTDVMIVIRDKDESDLSGFSYLDSGAVVVHKTKSGKSGYFYITFKPNSAKIYDQNKPTDLENNIQKTLI